MIGSASITYDELGTPLLNFEFYRDNTEVILKASVYSQKSWGKGEDAAHWSEEFEPAVTSVVRHDIHSEDLDGACLNRDLIIVDVEYKTDALHDSRIYHYQTITYNRKIEINKTLSYCKELCECCKFPEGLLNSALQVIALQYAIEANDVDRAVTYWNKWYNGEWDCKGSTKKIGGCGCA